MAWAAMGRMGGWGHNRIAVWGWAFLGARPGKKKLLYTVYHLSAIHFSNSEYAIMLRASRAFFLSAAVALHSQTLQSAQREGSMHTHMREEARPTTNV